MISVLCVTQREAKVQPYLLGLAELAQAIGGEFVEIVDGWDVQSNGSIESVLDAAISKCNGEWILRMDDDESASPELVEWLKAGEFDGDLFAFPRAHLWGSPDTYLVNPPLWPDLQTRFSKRDKAGGRHAVHAGSPHGTGKVIQAPIYHHKFLLRNYQERRLIAERYEGLREGAGFSLTYLPFGMPEDAFSRLDIQPLKGNNDGKRTRKVSK